MTGGRGRVADVVVLSKEERAFLTRQVRRHKTPRSLSDRCRIVLLCAEGFDSKEVARRLGVCDHTVGKWHRRFVKDRIEGLSGDTRSGYPRTNEDDQVAAIIEGSLYSKPKDATHWSYSFDGSGNGAFAYNNPTYLDCLRITATS